MNVIVFSKDRAMQLDAFLRSYQDHVAPPLPLHVLHLASSERHAKAYDQVLEMYPWAIGLEQSEDFKADLLNLLPHAGNVVFFVDDQVFMRRWDVLEEPGLSLRLGLNLTRNYNSADAPQPLPRFESAGLDRMSWMWSEGMHAWGYPLSLDGHVYDAAEFRALIKAVKFNSPNTLESELQVFLPQFRTRWGTCYMMSRVVNVPWNRVQTDWYNRHGEGNDVKKMLACWENGSRIDLRELYGVENISVHQEFPLALESRLVEYADAAAR